MDGRLSRRRTRLRFTGDRTSATRDGTTLVGVILLLLTAVVVALAAGRMLGLL